MSLWVDTIDPIELRSNATEDEIQAVIRAVYKQVLGNIHVMESQRLTSGESLLRNGDISVRQFVSMVAKSDLYFTLFFESSSPYGFIELNFKHLLGRPPEDQAEISEHTLIYNEQGYEAEIDSYIYSEEYTENFGENIVPYPRGNSSLVGMKNVAFNRMFALERGNATSDRNKSSRLTSDLATNLATKIVPPAYLSGPYSNTVKRFQILVTKTGIGPTVKLSKTTYTVSYEQLTSKINSIQRTGGKILKITEVG
ncbi:MULTISPECIES: phycobilisome rod-core linker polypeptide [Okeania]|uniref:Photosystem I reaction center subunit XII n=1 Tax=Okeania hirsuta TaxID=1458930 RepID=A0A3N6PYY8_9CYAN|nr:MULTISPECIES: phycobilisome rod-core linker polypeptide [Okeania]NES77907.1 photosystem I reaction center subunit XII [Okeania sp. SIO1H4]NES91279.1 photosystem I reaction center subunit XII [Okeania sp. SIO2B9]NET21436.1 photosystem I reaction center subunit XII [Okeania sp. SIO1H5]NET79339.1 photosystem I reaction center subunit XII [Okeania sp. SIO1F9]NET94686.1 photosystem I reaction center subunit XII [Okeania sp. SIO1H2]